MRPSFQTDPVFFPTGGKRGKQVGIRRSSLHIVEISFTFKGLSLIMSRNNFLFCTELSPLPSMPFFRSICFMQQTCRQRPDGQEKRAVATRLVEQSGEKGSLRKWLGIKRSVRAGT